MPTRVAFYYPWFRDRAYGSSAWTQAGFTQRFGTAGAINSGSATFTDLTASFVSGDASPTPKVITVSGAGAAGANLYTTISGFTTTITSPWRTRRRRRLSGASYNYGAFTHYHPSLAYYDSYDPAMIANHVQALIYAKMDAGIASW